MKKHFIKLRGCKIIIACCYSPYLKEKAYHEDAYKFKITDLKDEYILLFYNSNIDFVILVVNKKEKYD